MTIARHTKELQTEQNNFHAKVPALYEPRIKGTQTINGEQFYVGADGKLYRPQLFDAMFKVTRAAVKHNGYKGQNPCVLWRE